MHFKKTCSYPSQLFDVPTCDKLFLFQHLFICLLYPQLCFSGYSIISTLVKTYQTGRGSFFFRRPCIVTNRLNPFPDIGAIKRQQNIALIQQPVRTEIRIVARRSHIFHNRLVEPCDLLQHLIYFLNGNIQVIFLLRTSRLQFTADLLKGLRQILEFRRHNVRMCLRN